MSRDPSIPTVGSAIPQTLKLVNKVPKISTLEKNVFYKSCSSCMVFFIRILKSKRSEHFEDEMCLAPKPNFRKLWLLNGLELRSGSYGER